MVVGMDMVEAILDAVLFRRMAINAATADG